MNDINNHDLEAFFADLLQQHRNIDIANAEFIRLLDGDDELRDDYARWCDERGVSTRHGFTEFCEEYLDDQNNLWDSLNDYDE